MDIHTANVYYQILNVSGGIDNDEKKEPQNMNKYEIVTQIIPGCAKHEGIG